VFKLPLIVRISSGLVFLTVSILLLADLIGIASNQSSLVIDERRKFSEFLTIQIMHSIEIGQEDSIPSIMKVIKERNNDILSSAIRTVEGEIVLELGDHESNWELSVNDASTDDFIQVPVFKEGKDWGRIELRYRSLNKISDYIDLPIDDFRLLTIFVAFMGYLLYTLFLKRILKHIGSSPAVPSRVRNAMNALSEGVIILDNKEKIILVNSSICEKMNLTEDNLLGKNINKFPWKVKIIDSKSDMILPWKKVLVEKNNVSSIEVYLESIEDRIRTFVVNASPIEDSHDKINGMLCTFDDVTHIEEKNNELRSALSLLRKTQIQINKKNEELSLLASTDPLTECLNRRSFFEAVNHEFTNPEQQSIMSCIILDIDFFKKVNDDYGHTVGDVVIRALADTLKSSLRENDLLCRYGGEEFCVILHDTTAETAQNLAERARKKVEALTFKDSPLTENMKITASFGITDTRFNASTVEELIDQADQALYYAKENGRNKVTLWSDVIEIEKNPENTEDAVQKIETQTEDLLTGLPGRQRFIKVVRDTVLSTKEEDDIFAIVLLDIDMFKRINSSMGSEQGDLILQQFSRRLNSLVRNSDFLAQYDESTKFESIVSRVGGNEFAILVKEFKELSNIQIIANRLLDQLSKPYLVDNVEVHLTLSMGISIYPTDGEIVEKLISNSESALLRAKKEEGNAYRRYKKDVDATSISAISIENELRNAIRNREFIMYYQPKVDLSNNSVNSVEALIRWKHPIKGIISPDKFIPIAESSGLMHEIGKQVMELVFQQTVKWVNEGHSSIRVAINISPLQLQKEGFLESTNELLDQFACNPNNIEFELTETVLMDNIDLILPILNRIHDKGIKLSIDDFGVGYSSLNYIKSLPVDIIKIDKCFIDDIHINEDDVKLVSAIIAMAHAMKLEIVAEGIEHKQQLEILQSLKCNYIQGYYFSKPVPPEKIGFLLQRLNPELKKAVG